ncbi:DEAD/DEAH box helicase family protein [Streptomyces sp. NPDC051546]|uniref:DEAD/DEAH box helicase family protein n=1 Tax=Streptomyces sp. NPDC051546 TaxID=3365655 RepID=UPI00379427A5
MATKELRPHQQEAVDAVLSALELAAAQTVPERGLRTQVIMATGSGKSLVAARSAEELRAGRVLVLVPSLDLLAQTEAAWHEGGRRGPAIGVSSLRGEEVFFPNTTNVYELVEWTRGEAATAERAARVVVHARDQLARRTAAAAASGRSLRAAAHGGRVWPCRTTPPLKRQTLGVIDGPGAGHLQHGRRGRPSAGHDRAGEETV